MTGPRAFDVSIVVPTYNRRESLLRLLESLMRQTVDPARFEIVVVDNASTDDTHAALAAFTPRRGITVRYLREDAQGAAHARNRGIRASASDIVAFLDDDVEADPGWLAEIMRGFAESHAGAVGGRSEPVWDGPQPSWWLAEYDKLFVRNWGDEPCAVTQFPFFYSLNFAVRRDVLLAVGDFDPRLGPKGNQHVVGEDADLCRRIHESGRLLYYLPHAVVRHHVPRDRLSRRSVRTRFFDRGVTHGVERVIEGRPLEIGYQLKMILLGFARWVVATSSAERFRRELDLRYRAGLLAAQRRG